MTTLQTATQETRISFLRRLISFDDVNMMNLVAQCVEVDLSPPPKFRKYKENRENQNLNNDNIISKEHYKVFSKFIKHLIIHLKKLIYGTLNKYKINNRELDILKQYHTRGGASISGYGLKCFVATGHDEIDDKDLYTEYLNGEVGKETFYNDVVHLLKNNYKMPVLINYGRMD